MDNSTWHRRQAPNRLAMLGLTVLVSHKLIPCCLGQNVPLPQEVADKYGAKCLNGAPPTYEITRNVSDTRWVLFLEGGGWCFGSDENQTLKSCAGRGGFVWPPHAGTSPQIENDGSLPQVGLADIGGVMAQDPTINPDFYAWNKVFIHYCDGGSMGSSRTNPIPVSTKSGQPAQMWMRGRNNFDAVIGYLQSTLGMGNATEVILSGGSAGGLAVFYNLDHLATLLPQGVRLTGFPDAGFFLDALTVDGSYVYRQNFIGADPVWNVTGSGGTNKKCLAAYPSESWKCLMAPYLAEFIDTPIYVMNSAYDAYQLPNILQESCVPTPSTSCTDTQKADLQAYRAQMIANITAITSKSRNGAFIDTCFVHEQNVNYCSGQGMPNCVGWSPLSTGSKKWGYTTAITLADGRSLTPQQAFGAYYRGDTAAAVAIDQHTYFDNPTCHYLGKPVPPCTDFSGPWSSDEKGQTKPVELQQTGCSGTFTVGGAIITYTAGTSTITTDKADNGGRTGTLKAGTLVDTITWSDGAVWDRQCADFSGDWIDNPHWFTPVHFVQTGCHGTFTSGKTVTYTVHGNTLTASQNFFSGLSGRLVIGSTEDTIVWSNHAEWERNHTV